MAGIENSSNMTYRVYDYGRINKNGQKIELHFDKAVQVMNIDVAPDVKQNLRRAKDCPRRARELLCHCKYIEAEQI